MSMLTRHRFFLRCVSLFTAITFLPTSVQAWHFLPAPAQVLQQSAMSAPLQAEDADLAALLRARARAETYVAEGRHATAITVLLQSMREAPGDRVELADAAYGNGQMISYILLHLMPEPDAYTFAKTGFAADTYEIDRMVQSLCFIAIGLNTGDKTDWTREAYYLTSSENRLVRAITLYFMSLPYFYDNVDFTRQNAELLAQEFPDLDLAQTALNLPLYAAREDADFTDLQLEMDAKAAAPPPYKPWSSNLRARIRDCADNLSAVKETASPRGQALQPLLRGVTEAPDWRERYFALLLLKNEFAGTLGPDLRQAARTLAATTANTPDVLMARAELLRTLSADCIRSPQDTALRDEAHELALTFLDKGVTESSPERVMWETWIYSLQTCAGNLAAASHTPEALSVYGALAERLPGSKVAVACKAAMAELAAADSVDTSDPAE